MVDAAVGSKAVMGFGVEHSLGVRKKVLSFLNFISSEFSRDSKENESTSITGSGGRDRGTPGQVDFGGKIKFDLTVHRLLRILVSQHGAPVSSTPLTHASAVVVTNGGSGYATPPTVTPTGGGAGAVLPTFLAVLTANAVTSVTILTPGYGITAPVSLGFTGGGGTGAAATLTLAATDAWLLKIRPGHPTPTARSLWTYVDEGGSYTPTIQLGRRASEISISEDANKRMECDVNFAEPTGDTIAGFPVPKVTNTGTLDDDQITTRGRRAYDADFTANKSVYLKVISSTTTTAVVKAALDVASPGTGSGFPSPTYGSVTFTIRRPGSLESDDGFVTIIDSVSGLPLGLFGENNEPFEICFGDQSLATALANDEFEIPATMTAGGVTKVVAQENRLSTFHLIRKIGRQGETLGEQRSESGTVKLTRPFKAYYVNGRRLPDRVDPTGFITATIAFKKRLVNRLFRERQEAYLRLEVEDIRRFNTPIIGNIFEGVHSYYPDVSVAALKSGDITTKETLDEDITLEVGQPSATPTPPSTNLLCAQATFDAVTTYPYQINLVTRIDPAEFV